MEVSMGIPLYFIQFIGFSNQPIHSWISWVPWWLWKPPKCWSSPRPICEAKESIRLVPAWIRDKAPLSWSGFYRSLWMLFDYISLYGFIMAYVGFYWIIGFYWFMLVSFILVCMFDIIHAKSLRVPRFFCFSFSRSKSRQHRPSWREIQVGLTRHFMPFFMPFHWVSGQLGGTIFSD